MTIWKYPILVTQWQDMELPKGGEILSVQMQGGHPQMWVQVDPDAEPEVRVFRIYGTGQKFVNTTNHKYIATFQTEMFVWHLFETT